MVMNILASYNWYTFLLTHISQTQGHEKMHFQISRKINTVLLSTCLLLVASVAQAGQYYEAVTSNTMEGDKNGDTMTVHSWVDGDKSRVEFISGEKDGWMAGGNYLVTVDGGENSYLVNPKEKTYARFSFEEMMAGLGQAMKAMESMGGMVKMDFKDVSSTKLVEEPGGELMGYATTHYRFKSHYVMEMSIMGMGQTNTNDTIQDLWITDELDAKGFAMWLRPDRGMQTGNEGLDKLFNQEMGKLNGFPLKATTQTTMVDKKGKQHNSSSSTIVTVMREESISADKFEWPSDYQETSLIPDMGEGQEGEDGEKVNIFDMFKKSSNGN